jgi:NSS family neurotransmitter:Na+ symporter
MNQREQWNSKLAFILSAAGSAIGLGTMWKLPYTMGENGGGAFIIIFLIFNFFIGIPLFIAELIVGRTSQSGCVSAFSKLTGDESTSWQAVGWISFITTFLITSWYCVVAGWGLNYILLSIVDSCNHKSLQEISYTFELFRQSGDLNIFWQLIFISMTASIVYKGISSGIEFWNKIMTSTLFVILVMLAMYSLTLKGAKQALHYVLYPDFSVVGKETILKALGLSLFTLSLGYGIMITYGSYMSKEEDIPKTSLIVAIANLFAAILIALMIFPMVFTFDFAPQEGEGLIFKTLPFVFNKLPGSILISTTFFTLLMFAALTSSVSMLEVPVAAFMDMYKWSRAKSVLVTWFIGFVIGIPIALSESDVLFVHWKSIFEYGILETVQILIDWLIAIGGLLTAIFVGWIIPEHVRKRGFLGNNNKLINIYFWWNLSIKWIVPSSILVIVLYRFNIF